MFQGTFLSPKGDPINNLTRLGHMSDEDQRRQLALLARMNGRHVEQNPAEAELAARIENFELAYRMQTAAPEAFDIDQESAETKTLYGIDPAQGLRAVCQSRQHCWRVDLSERGVRFVQIFSGGMENQLSWDGHSDIAGNHRQFAGETDQPIAAAVDRSGKQRGQLNSNAR